MLTNNPSFFFFLILNSYFSWTIVYYLNRDFKFSASSLNMGSITQTTKGFVKMTVTSHLVIKLIASLALLHSYRIGVVFQATAVLRGEKGCEIPNFVHFKTNKVLPFVFLCGTQTKYNIFLYYKLKLCTRTWAVCMKFI